MDATNLKRTLKINQATKVSTIIRGNHGTAKSAVVAHYTYNDLVALHGAENVGFVDNRLSQQDVGDLRGIPHRINGQTFFAPPSWLPVSEGATKTLNDWLSLVGETFSPMNTKPFGVIFLDEFNRATREVLQCAFELVLDRKLSGISIPDGWQVVAAVNDNQDLYQVAQLDPALLNRFLVVDFKPTYEEWFTWAKPEVDKGNIHGAVFQYLKTHENKMDPSDADIAAATEQGDPLYTRRSWTNFGNFLAKANAAGQDLLAMENNDDINYLGEVAKGFLGATAMMAFIAWVKTEYKTLSAKMILNNMHLKGDKTKTHLMGLCKNDKIHEITALSNDLIAELKNLPDVLSDEVCGNICTYIEIIPAEAVTGFYRPWAQQSQKQSTLVYDWKEKRQGKPTTVVNSQGVTVPAQPFKVRVFAVSSKPKAAAATK